MSLVTLTARAVLLHNLGALVQRRALMQARQGTHPEAPPAAPPGKAATQADRRVAVLVRLIQAHLVG